MPAEPTRYTHVAIYHSDHYGGPHYEFHLSTSDEPAPTRPKQEHMPEGKLVAVLALARHHQDELEEESRNPRWAPERPLGWIGYRLREGTAVSESYYPKDKIPEYKLHDKARPLAGLGVKLERECLMHLKTLGVTHVKTTRNPEAPRRNQLWQYDLPINKPVQIDDWIAALDRGPLPERLSRRNQ